MADPWVAPDSQPAAPAGPTSVATSSAAGVAAPGAPALPVPLRPLTIADLLDGSLRIWKLAPATTAGLAAVFVVPAQVVLGVLSRDDIEDVELGQTLADALSATGPDDVDTGLGAGAFFVSLVGQGVALALVTAGVTLLVSSWYVGRRMGAGELAVAALRRTVPLTVAWVAVHVVELVFAVFLFVPVIVPMTWYAVVSAVIASERIGPFAAMGRSMRLANRRFGAVLGTVLLVALVDLVLTSTLTTLGGLYLELDLPAGWVVNTVVAAGALLVTVPFVAGVCALLYLDLRVRTEGLDIELAAAARLPATT